MECKKYATRKEYFMNFTKNLKINIIIRKGTKCSKICKCNFLYK